MNVSSQPHAPVALLLTKGSRYRVDKILGGPKTGMDSWQLSNLTHKFFSMYLFIVLYMFRACHAHHQEKQIVSIQLMVTVTPCWWQCRVLVGGKLVW